jgi:signal transduction histidine kinase
VGRLGLAGRQVAGVRRRRQRGAAGAASRGALDALVELIGRGLRLDRAAVLIDDPASATLVPAATWGAVRLTRMTRGARPPDGPWSAALPIAAEGRPVGLALLALPGGRCLAPAARALAVRLLDGVGPMLAPRPLDRDAVRARELLARADRLAVLGTLAAGIAHEVRNPLVSVRTFIELLPERLHDEEFRTEFRQLTLAEIDRICGLLNDLLAFTRPAPAQLEPCDLNALTVQTIRLLEPEARKRDVSLQVAAARDLPLVVVDEARVKQVVMNLVLNAIEASGARGEVRIATAPGRAGAWSVLEVADGGAGIPPELAAQVFDPFVTTKDSGSGLGLYIAHRIVTEHGGTIDTRARRGGGTVVSVTLPAMAAARDAGTG